MSALAGPRDMMSVFTGREAKIDDYVVAGVRRSSADLKLLCLNDDLHFLFWKMLGKPKIKRVRHGLLGVPRAESRTKTKNVFIPRRSSVVPGPETLYFIC